jgi:hypothetical protein
MTTSTEGGGEENERSFSLSGGTEEDVRDSLFNGSTVFLAAQ